MNADASTLAMLAATWLCVMAPVIAWEPSGYVTPHVKLAVSIDSSNALVPQSSQLSRSVSRSYHLLTYTPSIEDVQMDLQLSVTVAT